MEGHEGLLCESCSAGYIKQQDTCILCTGTAWMHTLSMFAAKTACLLLVDAQLLVKATTKSYTATTAFGTIIFTGQTIGLVVADSFQHALATNAPALAGLVDVLQLAVTPDKQALEKCAFPSTLLFKLLVEAVLQPAYAFAILAMIAFSWRTAGFSCGLRRLCDAKHATLDRLAGKMKAKHLKIPWNGEGVLIKGTWAKVAPRPTAGLKSLAPSTTRTVGLAECDPARILIAGSTLAAPAATDFDKNDKRELRRMLRALNITTTGRETEQELLKELRFQLDCDDVLFDNSKMPARLQRYQITQACVLLLMCATDLARSFVYRIEGCGLIHRSWLVVQVLLRTMHSRARGLLALPEPRRLRGLRRHAARVPG
jgi:hypothetical protein